MNGITFDQLMDGRKGYAPLQQLVRIENELAFEVASKRLRRTVRDLLTGIEQQTSKAIEIFTFGRTHANTKKSGQDVQDFDQTNFNTWTQDGIRSVWGNYYQRGYDGLVVLCALRRTSFPIPKDDFDQHSHVAALKDDLVVHFGYSKRDRRVGNNPLFAGSNQRPNAIAGVLFMAYKLKHDTQASPKTT